MLVTISYPRPLIEYPHRVNNFYGGSERYTAIYCIVGFLNPVLHGYSLQLVLLYSFTNMHSMSYRSDLFACSRKVNMLESPVCYTVTLLSTVFRVKLSSFLILTIMSDSICLNTSLLEFMISSKNKLVFIPDLSDLILQIIFDAW